MPAAAEQLSLAIMTPDHGDSAVMPAKRKRWKYINSTDDVPLTLQ
jgi:hypothetical protein